MTWLRIDDGHEMHPKVASLSDSAHRLWSRAAGWCSRYGTNGFVPAKVLSDVALNKYSKRVLTKLANELVEAKAGGLYKVGLWETCEGGWRFHDWHEYNPTSARSESREETFEDSQASDAPRSRSEAASIAGKASAEARKRRTGSAQPTWSKPAESSDIEGAPTQDDARTTFDDVREDVRANRSERRSSNVPNVSELEPEPPDPVPDPDPQKICSVVVGSKEPDSVPAQGRPQGVEVEQAQSESKPSIAPPPSGLRRAIDPSDTHRGPERLPPTAERNVARLPTREERVKTDLRDLPIYELAQAYQRNPTWVADSSPQTRPELAEIARAWDAAVGLTHSALGHATRDECTRKLLGLYADGATFEQLRTICEQAGRDEWLCGRTGTPNAPNDVRRRRIDVLTPKVFRRLLDAAEANRPAVSPAVAAMLAAERRRSEGT